jgi:uncharacterized HAD superfamily protein
MNYKCIADLNADIIQGFQLLPNDVDLIIGIPRSGMLAASILATHSHLPLIDVDGFIHGRPAWFGRTKRNLGTSRVVLWPRSTEAKKPLLFDDSLNSGKSMEEALQLIRNTGFYNDFYTGVVYVTPGKEKNIDFYFQKMREPRIFEWNLMHHNILKQSCVDIDGVLCRDPSELENDDGDNYRGFLLNVPAMHRPSIKIGWLVTCRLEKYREQTEQWLRKNTILYNQLIMLDLPSAIERRKQGVHASFKADVYKNCMARLFVESSYKQAVEIADLSGKCALCYENGHLVWPDGLRSEWAKQKYRFSYGGWKKRIPWSVRRVYRKIKQFLL